LTSRLETWVFLFSALHVHELNNGTIPQVYWSGTGNLVAIAGEDSFYVLRFDRDAYISYIDNGGELGDEGVEEAFELEADIADVVQTGKWIGDCFVYTTAANRLNYLVGGQTHTLTHFDSCVAFIVPSCLCPH
jgi:coatomer subunit beta'